MVTSHNFLAHMNDALDHYRDDLVALSVTGHTKIQVFASRIGDAIYCITYPCTAVLRRIKHVIEQGQ